MWGNANGQVFFSRHGVVNPQPASPKNLLAKRDFYRMPSLSKRAVEFLGQYVEQTFVDPGARSHATSILHAYVSFSRTESCLDTFPWTSERTKEQMRHVARSVGEQYLGQIERQADAVVEELRQGRIASLDSEVARDFFLLLGIQFFRTRRARAGIREAMKISVSDEGRLGNNVDRVLAHIHGETMGGLLYSRRAEYYGIALRNDTDRAFATGDQPVVNLLASSDGGLPEKTALYYPLSPCSAFLLLPKAVGRALRPMCGNMVRDLNICIADASREIVIGSSVEALERIESERPFRHPEMRAWIVS